MDLRAFGVKDFVSKKEIPFDEIPNEFLSLENSYCPDFIAGPSLGYTISLKGNKADLHLAEPEDLSNANIHIASFIRSATEFFNDINLTRKIYVQALSVGSFKINFKIEVALTQHNMVQFHLKSKYILK